MILVVLKSQQTPPLPEQFPIPRSPVETAFKRFLKRFISNLEPRVISAPGQRCGRQEMYLLCTLWKYKKIRTEIIFHILYILYISEDIRAMADTVMTCMSGYVSATWPVCLANFASCYRHLVQSNKQLKKVDCLLFLT